MNRLRSRVKNIVKAESGVSKQHKHCFETDSEIQSLRTALLDWYDVNKRDLQWRNLAKHEDPNIRAYSVLVSEIMLQQTQVATVKSYYSKWIEKWPNLTALSQATLEEVNTLWSGLGYYSRGRRLHEAACKVVKEMDGNMPQSAEQLQKKLPGVGPYTAAAIGSIAFNEPVGLVDGNVIRVFTRLFSIGGYIGQKNVLDVIWKLAHQLVDPKRPGDYNQALMELGATVCTPKSPSCESCPTRSLCGAYRRTTRSTATSSRATTSISTDIEDLPGCDLCLPVDQPWVAKDGVTNYPRKAKKTAARVARNIVLIVERPIADDPDSHEYLLWQRPANGLLANLWEFPSFASQQTDDSDKSSELTSVSGQSKGFLASQAIERFQFVTDVYHQFSHISQTYGVYHLAVGACEGSDDADMSLPDHYQGFKWMNARQISEAAISTAMKKVFGAFTQNDSSKASTSLKRKAKSKETGTASKKQMTLQSYLRNQNETTGAGTRAVKQEQK